MPRQLSLAVLRSALLTEQLGVSVLDQLFTIRSVSIWSRKDLVSLCLVVRFIPSSTAIYDRQSSERQNKVSPAAAIKENVWKAVNAVYGHTSELVMKAFRQRPEITAVGKSNSGELGAEFLDANIALILSAIRQL